MEVQVTRTGGFGGLRRHAAVAVDDLPAGDAERVRELVERARSEAAPPAAPGGADRFQLRIAVRGTHDDFELEGGEHELAPAARALAREALRLERAQG